MELMNAKPSAAQSDKSTYDLIHSLSRHFEERMNDDLDVKGAFDTTFVTISKLIHSMKEGNISQKDHQIIIERIRRIDEVLQVIF